VLATSKVKGVYVLPSSFVSIDFAKVASTTVPIEEMTTAPTVAGSRNRFGLFRRSKSGQLHEIGSVFEWCREREGQFAQRGCDR
jgi:hypothetical protein